MSPNPEGGILFLCLNLYSGPGHYFVFHICLFSHSILAQLERYDSISHSHCRRHFKWSFLPRMGRQKMDRCWKKISCLWWSASIYWSSSLKSLSSTTHLEAVHMPGYLIAPISALFHILSCTLTNMGIIAISELYINEMLRYTWAHMPCFHQIYSFAPWLQHPHSARITEYSPLMTSISSELRGKLQEILMAVKAIVAARKKGRGRTLAADADGMGGE